MAVTIPSYAFILVTLYLTITSICALPIPQSRVPLSGDNSNLDDGPGNRSFTAPMRVLMAVMFLAILAVKIGLQQQKDQAGMIKEHLIELERMAESETHKKKRELLRRKGNAVHLK